MLDVGVGCRRRNIESIIDVGYSGLEVAKCRCSSVTIILYANIGWIEQVDVPIVTGPCIGKTSNLNIGNKIIIGISANVFTPTCERNLRSPHKIYCV